MEEQPNKLERIARGVAFVSAPAGVVIGGVVGYLTKNPVPVIYGTGMGIITSMLSAAIGIVSYANRTLDNSQQ